MDYEKNVYIYKILMQTKTTTSRTISKNRINPQKNSNTLKKYHTKPQTGNGDNEQLIGNMVLSISAILLAIKFRKPLKKAIKEAFDEFMKNAAIQRRIQKLAIKKYNETVPPNRRRIGSQRDIDPLYIQIYSQIAEKEWEAFRNSQ